MYKWLPVYLGFIPTFGLASFAKWTSGGVPGWFQKQFESTILNPFPGSLGLAYYSIALLEGVTTLLFLVSLARLEFSPGKPKIFLERALFLAAITFGILGFGLRLTQDFTGAFQLFVYLILTVFLSVVVDQKELKV